MSFSIRRVPLHAPRARTRTRTRTRTPARTRGIRRRAFNVANLFYLASYSLILVNGDATSHGHAIFFGEEHNALIAWICSITGTAVALYTMRRDITIHRLQRRTARFNTALYVGLSDRGLWGTQALRQRKTAEP